MTASRSRYWDATMAKSRTSPPNSFSTAAGDRSPNRLELSASIQVANGSAMAWRRPETRSSSTRRTSRSSITRGDDHPVRRDERGPAGDDGQGQAVEGADLEAGEVGGAFLHLFAGPDVEGQQADGRWVDVSFADQVAGPFGEHPGLARSGRGDDAGSAAAVGDGFELIGRQVGLGRADTGGGQRSVGQVHGGDDTDVEVEPVQRPAVAPSRSVGRVDIARPFGAQRGAGGDCPRHGIDGGGIGLAGVDGMVEHEVAFDLALELGLGRQVPVVDGQHRIGIGQVYGQLDGHPTPLATGRTQVGNGVGPAVDDDSLGVLPRCGDLTAGFDHHVAAQFVGTGQAIPVRSQDHRLDGGRGFGRPASAGRGGRGWGL